MIRRFSTLYVGHIELEQCGLAGIPADDRRYPNARLSETFETADGAGASHRRARIRHALARRAPLPARRLRVHPEHPAAGRRSRPSHPAGEDRLRVQHRSDLASAPARRGLRHRGHPDERAVSSSGSGRGYHSREVETFGNPMLDGEANRELFEEQVEIILEDAFAARSRSRTRASTTRSRPRCRIAATRLQEITLVPRPLHQPVEVWQPIVSGSARSLDFMARQGIKGVVSATAEQFVERWFARLP